MNKKNFGFIVLCLVIIAIVAFGIGFILTRNSPRSLTNTDTTITEMPGDFQISLTRGVCFGFCPAYTVTIHADGKVEFNGENFVDTEGLITYSIPAERARALFNNIQSIDFYNLKDRYVNELITDLPSLEISVLMNGKAKTIYMYGMEETVPASLTDLAQNIDTQAETESYIGDGGRDVIDEVLDENINADDSRIELVDKLYASLEAELEILGKYPESFKINRNEIVIGTDTYELEDVLKAASYTSNSEGVTAYCYATDDSGFVIGAKLSNGDFYSKSPNNLFCEETDIILIGI